MGAGSSRVPSLIDYLVSTFTNATTLGQASPPVTVYDGPPTTLLDAPLKLYVGLSDPDSDQAESAATFTQSRDDLGLTGRLEETEIRCVAEAWSGDDSIQVVRLAVFGIVAAVEALVRADATRFGGNAALAAPGVTTGELLQNNTDHGAIARVSFSLMFKSFT